MTTRLRGGFTLVELLVVIAIIAMLAAMVLPAVHMADEQARRTRCLVHQRELAVGLVAFETSAREFPGYVNRLSSVDGANPRRASWVVMIMNQLGRPDIYDAWQQGPRGDRRADTFHDFLVCPSDFPEGLRTTQLSYVVNCGRMDTGPESDRIANGIFHDRYSGKQAVSMSRIRMPASTLLLTENIQAKSWNVEPDIGADSQSYLVEKYVGTTWDARPLGSTTQLINVGKDGDSVAASGHFARPSSNHSGGVNAVFCDTRGVFLHEGIDRVVLEALMTTDHGRSDSTDPAYILNGSDYP